MNSYKQLPLKKMNKKMPSIYSLILIVFILLKVSSASDDERHYGDYVKYQAKTLLESVNFLRGKLDVVLKKTFIAQDSIPRYYGQIKNIVNDNHKIVDAKKLLLNDTLGGQNVEQCKQVLDQHIQSLVNSSIHSFTAAALQHVRSLEEELKGFKEILDNIEYALRFNEKAELESCAHDYVTCNIMSTFSQKLSEKFKSVSYQEFHAEFMIPNLIQTMDFAVLNPEINDSILRTVEICISDSLRTQETL